MMKNLSVELNSGHGGKISSFICSKHADQAMRSILKLSNKKPGRFQGRPHLNITLKRHRREILLKQGVKT